MDQNTKQYILQNADRLSPAQMAKALNMKERKIKKFLLQNPPDNSQKENIISNKHLWMAIAAVIMAGFLTYANTLQSPFIWDDINLVEKNPTIHNLKNLGRIFKENLGFGVIQQRSASYRPLQSLTYMIDYSIWKNNVLGFHLTNIIFHILSALGVLWLVLVVLRNGFLAVSSALIYVVHPLHSEAVAYISGRADPLSTCLFLSSMILYLQSFQKRSMVMQILMLLTFIGALLSRESTLMLPMIVLLYHFVFKKPVYWKSFLFLVGTGVLYIVLRVSEMIGTLGSTHTVVSTLGERLPGVFVAITNYLKLIIFPMPLHMEYAAPLFAWSELKVFIGIASVLGLCFYAFQARKKNPLVSFSILWFFLTLLPVLNIFPVNAYMAEHWLYVPLIGAVIFIVNLIKSWSSPSAARVVIGVLVSVLMLLTHQQNKHWQSHVGFYEYTLKFAPDSSRLHSDLGVAYYGAGRIDDAIKAFKRAIEIKPDFDYAYNNLGAMYLAKGQLSQAIVYYEKAVELNPHYGEAYYNLGNGYRDKKQYEKAAAAYQRSLELNPRNTTTLNNVGVMYKNLGQRDKAKEFYERAIAIDPNDFRAIINLGNEYSDAGQYDQAIEIYQKAITIAPRFSGAYHNLANAYSGKGDMEKAIQYYKRAIELGSTELGTYASLANIYKSLGRQQEFQLLSEKIKALTVAQ